MIDDTRESSDVEYSYSLSAEIVEISKYRTDRNDALQWARNLRFLAYDDSFDDDTQKKRRQECAVCHAAFKLNPLEQRDVLDPTLFHVCDKPFHNNHRLTTKELQTHPMRFSCDICNSGIWAGTRNHCGQCLSGDFDLCDACVASGKHCLNPAHNLEKTPVFRFGECVHVNARSCGDCEKVPLFPNEAKFSNCDHFVAVSYCWPPLQYDTEGNAIQHKGRYSVKDLDGRVRPNRAPEDVITRAVEFAAQSGIRLIWIDQECIDQEDPADKELGIQVMDKVYQRAFLSIGLLRSRIESQDTLRALHHVLTNSDDFEGFSNANIPTPDLVESLISFFGHVMNDPWHTRAWVLQESLSAGPRMVLLLQRSPEVIIEGLPGISKTLSVSEVALHLDLFIMLIDYATGFLLKSLTTLPITNNLTQKRLSLLRQFRRFSPGDERSLEPKWTHRAGLAQPRRSCNAAVALSYLRTRDNTHVPDRLAILANLCNYDIRLNTIQVEKNHQHLGPCVFALALINGDFSLLYPEVYRGLGITEVTVPLGRPPETSDLLESSKTDKNEFSWLRMMPKNLRYLDARFLNSFAYYLPSFSATERNLSSSGLSTLAYLWKVDRKIHLTEFKEESMKLAKITWFRTRHANFTIHVIRNPSYASQTLKRIFTESPVMDDLDEEQKINLQAGAGRASEMNAEEYEVFSEKYRIHILEQVPEGLESIFFGETVSWLLHILYMLRKRDEIEVADAIWQSVRADNWDVSLSITENRARGCFNSVAEFPPMDDKGNISIDMSIAVDMFQLDWDRDGGLRQCWIIDSLFRDGYLSIGKFVRISSHDDFEFHPEWFVDSRKEKGDEAEVANVESTMALLELDEGTVQESGQVALDSTTQPKEDQQAASDPPEITESETTKPPIQISDYADTQLFKQLIMSSLLSLLSDVPAQSLSNPTHFTTSHEPLTSTQAVRSLIAAAMLYGRMVTDWDADGIGKLKSMRAIFDIRWDDDDEEVKWVLTPYDQKSERLPHAEARAMSMSWAVEPTGDCPDGKEGAREVLRTKGAVRGMWRFMDLPLTQYLLI
ncbi:heterokaryon incompatibility protein-domain-containing protein [Leptodontidium sp. MPI-SDFR-AT-0119]|nr:heterokaryon incompatibility protein-domain-containing protein [Leptodontidium sp. MPI-SDFR-AT-0119]